MKKAYYVRNKLFETIKRMSFSFIIKGTIPKTMIVKVYETDENILYQIKNAVTKRSIRFVIHCVPKEGVIATLLFRSRNPNTVEYFKDFFSIKEKIEITDKDKLEECFEKARSFILLNNPTLNTSFEKINTTKDPKELNEKNLLLKIVDRVDMDDKDYIFSFQDNKEILKIPKDTKFKLPFQDDLMLTDVNGNFQFYSQAKARYHFNFIQSRKNNVYQNQTSSEVSHANHEESCCV